MDGGDVCWCTFNAVALLCVQQPHKKAPLSKQLQFCQAILKEMFAKKHQV